MNFLKKHRERHVSNLLLAVAILAVVLAASLVVQLFYLVRDYF